MSVFPIPQPQSHPSHQDADRSIIARPLRLLQLTDLHLFAEPDGRLLGVTTRLSFEAVLQLALTHSQRADALILTGDLVHDETPAGYHYLQEVLQTTRLPYYCIPGNHDHRGLMEQWLGAAAVGPISIQQLAHWNLVFLDSTHPHQESGRLHREQLEYLNDHLVDNKNPTLIFLHHHPIPVGSLWMDTLGVENGEELTTLCARYPQVRGVVCGHIHQEFAHSQHGYQILGSPSTCIQFLPLSPHFALDLCPPGYRELELHADGRIESRVIRLDQYPEAPLQSAEGY